MKINKSERRRLPLHKRKGVKKTKKVTDSKKVISSIKAVHKTKRGEVKSLRRMRKYFRKALDINPRENYFNTKFIPFSLGFNKYKECFDDKSLIKVDTLYEYKHVIYECLKTIAYLWSNAVGGVYVEDVGYLGVMRVVPKKEIRHQDFWTSVKGNIIRKTGQVCTALHSPISKKDTFSGFTLRFPYKDVRWDILANMDRGKRYTYHYELLKEYRKKRVNE